LRAMKEFAHPGHVEQTAADINHAVQTTLIMARNEYKYSAQVETHLGELPDVVCNVSELNQVFLNIIVNAAHALRESGKDASTGRIRITTEQAGDRVLVRIADNGCGIPKENLEKIFDPFFTTKEVGLGTGQGLAIARSIVVDKHGGDIGVESEPDVGTTFTLSLPVEGRCAPAAAA
jgi:two-component system NtrC family sensor kinase